MLAEKADREDRETIEVWNRQEIAAFYVDASPCSGGKRNQQDVTIRSSCSSRHGGFGDQRRSSHIEVGYRQEIAAYYVAASRCSDA